MFFTISLVTVISVFIFSIFISQRKYQYWHKKKVPFLPPVPILGNYSQYILQKKDFGAHTQQICQHFPNEPYIGAYYGTEPTLIVQDPNLIKLIMAKDFNYFNGREITKYNHKEILVQNLFFTYGNKWKALRQNLTPLFSIAKMKNMFHLIEKCCHVFENILDQETKKSKVVEVRSLSARFTMDCVSSCAFGVDANTMEQNENNPFSVIGDVIFDSGAYAAFKSVARSIWPAIFYGLGLSMYSKEIETFFYGILNKTVEARNYKPSNRNDFVDLVLKLNNKDTSEDNSPATESQEGKPVSSKIDEGVLMSQCFGLFAAGFETSATSLGFVMLELAKNLKAQEKVLEEVDAYLRRHENVLKYECVSEMPYLFACMDEAFRLYPALAVLTREVTEDYIFPTGLKVEKGLRIHIPVYHMHYNPEYFPEPEKYIPERFFGDEKQNVKPYTYMPFGEGQRICIGIRFARMQMTVALITVLKKYRLILAADMNADIVVNPRAMVTQAVGGIRLEFVEREGWEQRLLRSPS